MSRILSRRLTAQSPLSLLPEVVQSTRLSAPFPRSFSHTTRRRADGDDAFNRPPPPPPPSSQPPPFPAARSPDAPKRHPPPPPKRERSAMMGLASTFSNMIDVNQSERSRKRSALLNTTFSSDGTVANFGFAPEPYVEPHHFHIYATRHNTHITLTDPKRNPLISVSCGNIGFKHSARKHYDSAFQLASLVMNRMQDQGINQQIKEVEVVLRGFGAGREAVTKAILGLEGKFIRHKIIKVADATRLKFGGTRSKKPRRLG